MSTSGGKEGIYLVLVDGSLHSALPDGSLKEAVDFQSWQEMYTSVYLLSSLRLSLSPPPFSPLLPPPLLSPSLLLSLSLLSHSVQGCGHPESYGSCQTCQLLTETGENTHMALFQEV